ncbi:SDR family NAD(P)-dependent oxidoreductase [Reichenbachiella versicolor]|uniref:SDR family NAD(P)-dependent oxidoreductase n=1 Tax=Reichenbachiella versicolor TaxID=1821036 RepID=UPI000D6DF4A3|nr:SDR family NAD(P)-dependent oxidoreductase [Reichenbachiella versicolor]
MYKSIQKLKSLALIFLSVLALSTFNASAKTKADSKVAIITGSNRGQGLGWTKYYLEKGYTVIATARKPESADQLQALKKQYKKKLMIEKLDVTSLEDANTLSNTLTKKKIKIDIAISNAGVTVKENFGEWTEKSLIGNFKVNTMGAAFFAQMLDPHLKNGAKVIQLSSGAGCIACQKKSNEIDSYAISKAGLNMLTKKLSFIWADRQIIVVSMTPGGVKTDMNPTAKRTVEEAIPMMAATVEALTIEQTGTFINFKGKNMPW